MEIVTIGMPRFGNLHGYFPRRKRTVGMDQSEWETIHLPLEFDVGQRYPGIDRAF